MILPTYLIKHKKYGWLKEASNLVEPRYTCNPDCAMLIYNIEIVKNFLNDRDHSSDFEVYSMIPTLISIKYDNSKRSK